MPPARTPLGDSDLIADALKHLAETIDARAGSDATSSWTAKLLAEGPHRCAKKFGEEAVEFALAVAAEDESKVASEAADALYHLMVALRSRGVALEAVAQALAARQGRSGLEEKASRA